MVVSFGFPTAAEHFPDFARQRLAREGLLEEWNAGEVKLKNLATGQECRVKPAELKEKIS